MKEKKNLNKGHYGHLKRYKQIRLLIIFSCLAFIIADVLFSLIVFQTRRTLFIIVAAIMSIPFAKNFVQYLLALKCKPLNNSEYEETEKIADKYGIEMLYDISITDDDIKFFPCGAIVNNSLTVYYPEAKDNNKQKEAREYIRQAFSETDDNIRIGIVDNLSSFDKELGRLVSGSKEIHQDSRLKFMLLDAGF